MFNLKNKNRDAYLPNDLVKFEGVLTDYWDKSRTLESETIKDLEKHLWLANAAAATASIGFIQVKNSFICWQYAGAWAFISGILALVLMKYISSFNSSRDRYRFQNAKSRFDAGEVTDYVFQQVRDYKFHLITRAYHILQFTAGAIFIFGLILTLIGVGSPTVPR